MVVTCEHMYEALKDLLDDVKRERSGFGRGYEVSHVIEEQAKIALQDYEEAKAASLPGTLLSVEYSGNGQPYIAGEFGPIAYMAPGLNETYEAAMVTAFVHAPRLLMEEMKRKEGAEEAASESRT